MDYRAGLEGSICPRYCYTDSVNSYTEAVTHVFYVAVVCNIRVGGSTVFYKTWKEKGIWFINDLLDENGDLLTY